MSMTAEGLDGVTGFDPAGPESAGFEPEPAGFQPPAVSEPDRQIEVSPARLNDLGTGVARAEARPLRLLAGVQVDLTVELGRSRIPLQDLLTLAPGAVVELDRPADATVDILVNGTVVARGEVVVVDGDFGVRITEITGGR